MEYNPSALKAFGHEPAAALDEARALGFGRVEAIDARWLARWTGAMGRLVERETARLLGGPGRGEFAAAEVGLDLPPIHENGYR